MPFYYVDHESVSNPRLFRHYTNEKVATSQFARGGAECSRRIPHLHNGFLRFESGRRAPKEKPGTLPESACRAGPPVEGTFDQASSSAGGLADEFRSRDSPVAPDLATDGLLQRFALIAIRQLGLGEENPEVPAIEAAIPRVALALAGLDQATYRFDQRAAEELWAIKGIQVARDGPSRCPLRSEDVAGQGGR